MLRARSKKLSLVLVLAMIMTMFAGLGVANAAGTTYVPVDIPPVQTSGDQMLGVTKVTIDDATGLKNGDVLTFSLPSSVTIPNGTPAPAGTGGAGNALVSAPAATLTPANYAASRVEVVVPANIPGTTMGNSLTGLVTAAVGGTGKSLDITFTGGAPGTGVLYIYWNYATLSGVSGDVTATVMGSSSLLPMGTVVLAKAGSNSGTQATIKSQKSFGASGSTDTITLVETVPNSIKANEVIKLKLPAGFTWSTPGLPGSGYAYNWAWTTLGAATIAPDTDTRILNITMPAAVPATTQLGRIDFWATITADSDAKMGDVVATLYSDLGNVTEQEITVAKYGEYGAKLVEGTTKDLIAGKASQKLGTFYVEEVLPGSLINGRTVKLTLPEGVKWSGEYNTAVGGTATYPAPTQIKGTSTPSPNLTRPTPTATSNTATDSGRTLTFTVPSLSSGACKIELKDYKVDVAPDFSGDITITASGSGGCTGEVVVGKVIPAVDLSASKTDIRIGERDQALGEITIKETVKGAIAYKTDRVWVDGATVLAANQTTNIDLILPNGCAWASGYPTVTVTEGDIELRTSAMSKPNAQTIRIPVKSESTKASTIKISGLKINVDRTVAEGNLSVAIGGRAIDMTSGAGFPFAQFEGLDVVAANVITPAPSEGTEGAGAGEFRIDSNIYYVAGVAKVMDVAPYIKGDRTYVPMRYLGEILGAEVVWDDAARTVTLTKGEDVVVFTIGSTTYTVNGEAKTADVAPEITNDRTMLPARFVAEAFGSVVGWDPGTRTVLISK